ncbi:MAG: GAF domain-containing protein, partial [Ilumatobacteraceae bacterium]
MGVLILLLGSTAVGILKLQTNEISQLSEAFAPAIDANNQVLQTMTEAKFEQLGYQTSHNVKSLTAYRDARARAFVALATLRDALVLLKTHSAADDIQGENLESRQRRAVEQWWLYALTAEDAGMRGERIDNSQSDALFDDFRLANTAVGTSLRSERDHALKLARAISITRMMMIIATTLVALGAIFVLGLRYSRSVSQPITELRDTMTRQRKGDPGARAREDHGSLEIRSLAIDFNTLAEKNLSAQRRVEDVNIRMASLVNLGLALGQELSLDALLIKIVESARSVIGARYAALGVLDATHTGLAKFVTAGLSPEERAAIGEWPEGRGLLGAIIHDPQILRLEHLADDPRSVGFPPNHPPMDSFLGAPIVIHGEVFGNLYLTDKVDGSFTAEDEQVLLSLVMQASVAVENVRRYGVERERANMLADAQEIERVIRAAPDTQQSLDVLCASLGEKLGADRVTANTVDVNHSVVLDAQWHESSLEDVPDDLVMHLGPLAEKLWLSTERLVRHYSHPSQVLSEQDRIFHREIGTQAVIVVPIGLGDRALGTIHVIVVHEPRQWTESEINLVQQVAVVAAQVIVETEYRMHQREHIKRLERLERQQTNFVATVSHELRTPLTSIAGYLELLEDGYAGELTGDQRRMLEVMDRNTVRLRRLIDDLLVLNQNQNDGRTVDIVDVSMRRLITDACQDLLVIAQRVAIELDIDTGSESAVVNGDIKQLKSAVANIVSNAIKFSHPGGVVTVRCTLDQSVRRVRVTCQDRGIGIPADDQRQLFTRFFRASNATDQVIPGTG